MKIQLSEHRIIRHGHLLPLWDVLDWMDQEYAPGHFFIYPKLGVRGVLKPPPGLSLLDQASWGMNPNIASGKVDGRNPACGPIRVDTPPEKKREGMRVYYVPKGFREEPRAVVEAPDGIWTTACVFVGDSLELTASERTDTTR